jgi:hypothetical protein
MLRGLEENKMECTVFMTYSEKKAMKIAKNFMKNRDKNLYARYEVDITMFRRLYKRSWSKKYSRNSKIAPNKTEQIFMLKNDHEKLNNMGDNVE